MEDDGKDKKVVSIRSLQGPHISYAPPLPWTGPKEPYQPVEMSKGRSLRLRVYFSNGNVEIFSYSDLKNIFHLNTGIALRFPDGLVRLLGNNVFPLLDGLQEQAIRALIPFNPNRHEKPEDDTPVIRDIQWRKIKD